MARHPRYALPGQPHHVIQRGNNRSATFLDPADFAFYRACLADALTRYECRLHAYVLMTNHVHLLISPQNTGGVSRVMQCVGRRYVARFNKRYDRTGTLWEGRFRATVVDSEQYLFTCYRYIELNPVRAGLVPAPSQYRWSSYAANALGAHDPLIIPHDQYVRLGATASRRQTAYRALFRTVMDPTAISSIREATNKGWALGDDAFRIMVTLNDRRAFPLARWSDIASQR